MFKIQTRFKTGPINIPSHEEIRSCHRCRLHVERSLPVVGEGSLNASVVFIGEAPGRNEDRTGRPFVGAAGQVLNQMLEHIGLERDEVYITNVVKCRPPGNRQPLADEVNASTPFLDRQLETIKPPILVPMGNSATGYTMKRFGLKERSIGQIHGRSFATETPWGSTIIFPLYHPATMLYNKGMERFLLADFESLKELLTEKNTGW